MKAATIVKNKNKISKKNPIKNKSKMTKKKKKKNKPDYPKESKKVKVTVTTHLINSSSSRAKAQIRNRK